MGAYSYQVAGIQEDDYLALDHPVNKSLWFTGEYTGHLNFGYAHEAYKLGGDVAVKIMNCMKENKCHPLLPKVTAKKTKQCKVNSSNKVMVSGWCLSLLIICIFLK